ncbi:hypothetical protein ACODT3_42610 [Streptomyces sp. 4.24]|uniref:hypothetical protein n=1 Tax=Streptomyces tritrimontium TaxID=3406573 RepID=UPI003BB4DD11
MADEKKSRVRKNFPTPAEQPKSRVKFNGRRTENSPAAETGTATEQPKSRVKITGRRDS